MKSATKSKPRKRNAHKPSWSKLADHEKTALAEKLEHLTDGAFAVNYGQEAFANDPSSRTQLLSGYIRPDTFDDEIIIDLRKSVSPQRQLIQQIETLAKRLEALADKMRGRTIADEAREGGAA